MSIATKKCLLLSVGLLMTVLTASAQAATFCVNDSTCSGTAEATIQNALDSASSNGSGRDTIEIGAGSYVESGILDVAGNPVDIIGAGASETLISRSSSSGATTLMVSEPSSTVSNVGIAVATGSANYGLRTSGDVDGVAITGGSGVTNGTGVMTLSSADLRNSTVVMPFSATVNSVGVYNYSSGVVENSSIEAGTALQSVSSGTGTRTVRRVRLRGNTGMFISYANYVIEDTQIQTATGSGDPVAIYVSSFDSLSTSLDIRHTTVVGNGGTSTGIRADALSIVDPASTTVSLKDSIVSGFATDVQLNSNGTLASVSVPVDYSVFDLTSVIDSGTGPAAVIDGGHNITADPLFVDQAGSDFHLSSGSPAIDAGDPAGLATGESTTDLDGEERVVDGNADGTARSDMGAFEYRPSSDPAGEETETPGDTGSGDQGGGTGDTGSGSTGSGSTGDGSQGSQGSAASTATEVADTQGPDITITKRAILTRRGYIKVRVHCPATEPGPCSGELTLTVSRKRLARSAATVKLGKSRFSVAAGKTKTIKVRVSKRRIKALRHATRRKALRITAKAVAYDTARNATNRRVTLSLRRERR